MDDKMREEIALFRHQVIAPVVAQELDARTAAAVLRELAGQEYRIPHSQKTRIGLRTLRRWVSAYRAGGLEALRPQVRNDKARPRVLDPAIVELACDLRREVPERSVRQIITILELSGKVAPGTVKRSTLADHLVRRGFSRQAVVKKKHRGFRRFGAEHRNDCWQGDCQHTLALPHPDRPGTTKKVYLLAWLDDYSRLVYGQFYWEEKGPRLEDCLKRAILRNALPRQIYVDNGSIYSSRHLARVAARLNIRLSHSRPYQPAGRGKIEKFFRYVDTSFLPEARNLIDAGRLNTLDQLNEFFWAWLEVGYNNKPHSATGQAPRERFAQDPTPLRKIDPVTLREIFLWEEQRTVDKTGCFRLHGNTYEVETSLARRRVMVRYDPYDLARIEVWHEGRRFADAVPFRLRRHRHQTVAPVQAEEKPVPTGLNLLELVKKTKTRRRAELLEKTSYASPVARKKEE